MRLRWIPLAASMLLAAWIPCAATSLRAADTAYDTLQCRDRTKIVGICLGRDTKHVYMAVRRQAVEGAKGAIQRYLETAAVDERVAYEQIRDRTQAMLQEPTHDAYRFILEQERDRAVHWLDGTDRPPSECVILAVPLGDGANLELASPENHTVGLWTWHKQLDAPESSSASTLREGLERENVDWKRDLPDLGLRFQAMPQSGDEWRARMAIVRYSRDREIEFQGTPGMMVRVGDRNAPADVAGLLAQGVQQQSQDLLGELLDGRRPKQRDWLESCQEKLLEERDDYFRASCMDSDVATDRGSVDSVFMVRLGKEWKTLWRTSVPIDTNAVSSATRQQVENDPQIRSLLSLAQSLGVGSQQTVDRALKMGAATMHAQSQANTLFESFRQRYQHRLDLPVLRWDISSPERRPGR